MLASTLTWSFTHTTSVLRVFDAVSEALVIAVEDLRTAVRGVLERRRRQGGEERGRTTDTTGTLARLVSAVESHAAHSKERGSQRRARAKVTEELDSLLADHLGRIGTTSNGDGMLARKRDRDIRAADE